MEKFTVEEINLMCIYDTSDKATLLSDLRAGLRDVYEPEMIEIFDSTIAKLEAVTDEEFTDVGFYIADDFIEGEFDIAE